VIEQQDVIESVAPIQLGIRLLIPEGSRMLELENVRRLIEPFDAQSLLTLGKMSMPRLDALSETVQEIAAAAEQQKDHGATFERIWKAAHAAAGLTASHISLSARSQAGVPFSVSPGIAVPSRPGTSWSPSAPRSRWREIPSQALMALFDPGIETHYE